jgi:antitoxin (DNA-binding transcriptional repressor) of toxin-antitoxin stability system
MVGFRTTRLSPAASWCGRSRAARNEGRRRRSRPPFLASCDYNVVMTTVRIAELKARLSEHLRSVRKGRTLTVLDRETPIARIVPYKVEPIEVRRATRRLRDLKLPPPPAAPTDSVGVLLDDRRQR